MYICGNNKDIPPYSAKRNWGDVPTPKVKEPLPEILAPASSDSYKNAVYNGADAIYFGYKELNARAKGANFASLKEVVDFCHIFGVKAYLAINISLKSNELETAREIIKEAEEAKIDAFIISDLALIPIIRRYSKAQIHASTQMGVHNVHGARFLEKMGFDRVVVSREVSIEDIKAIKNACNIEVEAFVHGALCVAFSGACLLSSMLTGNSGNRGRCNQLCRRYYSCFTDGKKETEGYLLSAKDIKLFDRLKDLKAAGVDSFKIEGRLRRPEYVGGVTNIYKHYLINDSPVKEEDENTLKILYNRGDYISLYFGDSEKIYPYVQGHIGMPFGKIIEVRPDNTAVVSMDFTAAVGDGFKILRDKREVAGGQIISDLGKYKYLLRVDNRVNVGDIACITTDTTLNASINEITSKVAIEAGIRLAQGEKAHIIASAQNVTVEIYGEEIVPEARTNPITPQEVKEQFSKTADTNFRFKFISVVCENAFLTKSQVNALRRKTIEEIEKAILTRYERAPRKHGKVSGYPDSATITGDFAEFAAIFPESARNFVNNIVYNPDNLNYENCIGFYDKAKKSDNLVFIKPPIFVHEKDFEPLSKVCGIFDGIIADNLAYIELAKSLGKKVVAGLHLNITNAKNPLIRMCDGYFASVELNKQELKPFKGSILYTYGNLPLMHLTHCPRMLNAKLCAKCGGKMIYKDQNGEYLITTHNFNGHRVHVLKNGIRTSLGNIDGYTKYFDFTEASNNEVEEVMEKYYNERSFSVENYNHLHLTRGVT